MHSAVTVELVTVELVTVELVTVELWCSLLGLAVSPAHSAPAVLGAVCSSDVEVLSAVIPAI